MKIDVDSIVFECTGRRVRASGEIVVVSTEDVICFDEEDGDTVGMAAGDRMHINGDILQVIWPEECAELADAMIAEWAAFKANRGPREAK